MILVMEVETEGELRRSRKQEEVCSSATECV